MIDQKVSALWSGYYQTPTTQNFTEKRFSRSTWWYLALPNKKKREIYKRFFDI